MTASPTRRLLRLADAPVLLQQVTLVADNIRSTFLGALLLVVVVRTALLDDSNPLAVNLWCAAKLLVQLDSKLIVRHFDRLRARGPVPEAALHRIVGLFVLNTALGGCLWGGLIWIAPAGATLVQTSVIVAVLAIVLSGAVSTVSALMPVFLALLTTAVLAIAAKLVLAAELVDGSLVLVGALYVLTLLDQARKGTAAVKASIQLRFENAALIEEVRQESEALQHARGEAERASAAKSKLLAAASHDLRQPVHAQGMFLDLLAKTGLTDRQRGLLDYANEAVAAQSRMLGTLFDFSRIEAGAIEPAVQVFAVQPLLDKLVREFAPQAQAKGLRLRSRASGLVVRSDPDLVELILRNLVANAIRYTERGGLLVACRRRAAQAVFEVWDTGIGIAPAQQREVFREFHQVDERDRKGFGLGLAIVDSLARRLGHEVSLASRPQRGSVFRLALPGSSAEPAAPDLPAGAPAPLPALDAHVLLIEDDESVRAGTLALLTSWGCTCDAAASVDEAIALARRRPPDLVLSDYRIRGRRPGLDAVAELRALPGQRFAALLITGDTHPERLKEAAAHRAKLLQKPVSPDQLHRALAAALPRTSTVAGESTIS